MDGETIFEQTASRDFLYFDQKDYSFAEELYSLWHDGKITSFRIDGRYEGDISCLLAFITEQPCEDFWGILSSLQKEHPTEKERKKTFCSLIPRPIESSDKQLESFSHLFYTMGYRKHESNFHRGFYYHLVLFQKEDGTTHIPKHKYKAKRRYINHYSFDSHDEALYYLSLLQWQQEGMVFSFQMQPRYLLQDKFEKNGKTYEKIEYVADFEVLYTDGHTEVCDIKGMQTTDFKIKQKWFEAIYPDLSIRLLKHSKQKGWHEIHEKPVINQKLYKRRKR